jgi:hypothetical protein
MIQIGKFSQAGAQEILNSASVLPYLYTHRNADELPRIK